MGQGIEYVGNSDEASFQGNGFALQAIRGQQNASAAHNWLTTNGRIVTSNIVESQQRIRRQIGDYGCNVVS